LGDIGLLALVVVTFRLVDGIFVTIQHLWGHRRLSRGIPRLGFAPGVGFSAQSPA
jgi:hypothetical protein